MPVSTDFKTVINGKRYSLPPFSSIPFDAFIVFTEIEEEANLSNATNDPTVKAQHSRNVMNKLKEFKVLVPAFGKVTAVESLTDIMTLLKKWVSASTQGTDLKK